MRKYLNACVLALALSACGSGTVVKERIVKVSVPVSQPCVVGIKPEKVASLKEKYPDWYDKSPKQKAELAAMQALERQSHGDQLEAATSACQ